MKVLRLLFSSELVLASALLCGGIVQPALAQVQLGFAAYKGQKYVQTNGAPALGPNDPFCFDAWVVTVPPTNATIYLPSGSSLQLPASPDDGYAFHESCFGSQAELDREFTNGNYRAVPNFSGIPLEVTVALTGNRYPNTPQLLDYAEAQQVNPFQPFTLRWAPFDAADENSWIQLRLFDDQGTLVFQHYVDPASSQDTQTNLPANTLVSEQTYNGVLEFYQRVDVQIDEYELYIAEAGYFKSSTFLLKTQRPLVLRIVSAPDDDLFRFEFDAVPGTTYRVEQSDRLNHDWSEFQTITATSSIVSVTNSVSSGNASKFFQVVRQ